MSPLDLVYEGADDELNTIRDVSADATTAATFEAAPRFTTPATSVPERYHPVDSPGAYGTSDSDGQYRVRLLTTRQAQRFVPAHAMRHYASLQSAASQQWCADLRVGVGRFRSAGLFQLPSILLGISNLTIPIVVLVIGGVPMAPHEK